MKKIILLLFCMPLLLASTCNDDDNNDVFCTTEFVYGLNVTIIDSATQQPITEGVTVIAQDGNYQETLEVFPGSEYVFYGAGERAGTYLITASKSGYVTSTATVTVTANECHVNPQQVQIVLTAN